MLNSNNIYKYKEPHVHVMSRIDLWEDILSNLFN